MRFWAVIIFLFATLSFSGASEFFSGVLDDGSSYTAIQDDTDSEKEDTKEKEEKDEKLHAKEFIAAEDDFLAGLHSGPSLEIRNGILRDSGYITEDHYPPPERA